MRRVAGLIGASLVLAATGLLVKKQLAPVAVLQPAPSSSQTTDSPDASSARLQSQQVQQQVRQSVESAVQRPRVDDQQ